MLFQADDFEVEFENMKVAVKVTEKAGRTVFEQKFVDGRKSLVIGRSVVYQGNKVWMSFPQGRMTEATAIGPKIVQHFLNLKKE